MRRSLLSPRESSNAWAKFQRFGPRTVRVFALRVGCISSLWRVSRNLAEAQGNRSRDTHRAKIALAQWVGLFLRMVLAVIRPKPNHFDTYITPLLSMCCGNSTRISSPALAKY